MRFLALDISKRSCGFAVWDDDRRNVDYGSWELGNERTPIGGAGAHLHGHITKIHRERNISQLFIEDMKIFMTRGRPGSIPIRASQSSLAALFDPFMHAHSWAYALKVPITVVSPQTWRKTFLGGVRQGAKRNELKDMCMSKAKELGFYCFKDDHADAIGILTHGVLTCQIRPYWLAQEFFDGVEVPKRDMEYPQKKHKALHTSVLPAPKPRIEEVLD